MTERTEGPYSGKLRPEPMPGQHGDFARCRDSGDLFALATLSVAAGDGETSRLAAKAGSAIW
jgi:hypothetical protein